MRLLWCEIGVVAVALMATSGGSAIAAKRTPQPGQASEYVPCVEGTPNLVDPQLERLSEGKLRPIRTAQCPYGFGELSHRIAALSTDGDAADSIETVEKAFGVPAMTTSYDDPRIADYSMVLSGKDGWRFLVSVREGFYPLNTGPDHFVPGLRPKRLGKVEDADLSIDLDVTGRSPTVGSVQCVPTSMLLSALTRAGWVNNSLSFPPAPDGGGRSPHFQYGNKSVSWSAAEAECVQHIFLSQKPLKS
jgi:hypothetical protein